MEFLVRLARANPNEVNECIDRTIGRRLVILWEAGIGTVNGILSRANSRSRSRAEIPADDPGEDRFERAQIHLQIIAQLWPHRDVQKRFDGQAYHAEE